MRYPRLPLRQHFDVFTRQRKEYQLRLCRWYVQYYIPTLRGDRISCYSRKTRTFVNNRKKKIMTICSSWHYDAVITRIQHKFDAKVIYTSMKVKNNLCIIMFRWKQKMMRINVNFQNKLNTTTTAGGSKATTR